MVVVDDLLATEREKLEQRGVGQPFEHNTPEIPDIDGRAESVVKNSLWRSKSQWSHG